MIVDSHKYPSSLPLASQALYVAASAETSIDITEDDEDEYKDVTRANEEDEPAFMTTREWCGDNAGKV
ncbi:hypothetical protein VCV18_004973 [Metarhizium anisopliae]